jgi:hypothetical protein
MYVCVHHSFGVEPLTLRPIYAQQVLVFLSIPIFSLMKYKRLLEKKMICIILCSFLYE